MNVDYQVVRFMNKIKPKDMGGLGIELEKRKGSGYYEPSRTAYYFFFLFHKSSPP